VRDFPSRIQLVDAEDRERSHGDGSKTHGAGS
jgi:hypothetical protein